MTYSVILISRHSREGRLRKDKRLEIVFTGIIVDLVGIVFRGQVDYVKPGLVPVHRI